MVQANRLIWNFRARRRMTILLLKCVRRVNEIPALRSRYSLIGQLPRVNVQPGEQMLV